MRQINPLYFILLLFVLLFFVLFKLMHTNTALYEAHSNFHKTQKMVHNVVQLRQNWDNEKHTKDAIARILRSSLLRHTGIIRKDKRGIIQLRSSSMDLKSVSYLSSRLFNETFIIKSMRIRRLNKAHVSFDAEIKL